MSFLLFPLMILFVVFIVVAIFSLSLLRGILSIFFPSLRKRTTSFGGFSQGQRDNNNQYNNPYNKQSAERDDSFRTENRKKIFSADEGEYVDFEEIKD
ncbi:MAG: DUF4834 family protein [Bacteroidales bacterium]